MLTTSDSVSMYNVNSVIASGVEADIVTVDRLTAPVSRLASRKYSKPFALTASSKSKFATCQ